MLRKTLALLVRALRVDARSIRPHLVRVGLLIAILWLLYIAHGISDVRSATGLTLFEGLTHVNIWFITLVGVTYFASAITEEKEERTLGLLRMADIGGGAILLGKWLPRVVGMLSLVMVQIPFTLLAITLGGVTLVQVTAVYVALFLHLVSVGTYSLLASVICRNTGTACRVTFSALFLRWLIPSLSGATVGLLNGGPQILKWIARLHEASVYELTDRALSTAFAGGPFPAAAAWWLGESAFLFGLSWVLFEPCTQGDVLSDVRPSLWSRWTARKQRSQHRRAWPAAIVGKDFMLLAGGVRGSLLRFATYVSIVIAFIAMTQFFNSGPKSTQAVGGMLFSFGIGFLALDVVQSAAKVFRVELQEQTWSALMMLPRTTQGIGWSKVGGCAVGWWPSLFMMAIGGLLLPEMVVSIVEATFHPDSFFPTAYFVMQVVLFVELTVLTSISLTWAAWPLAAPLSFFLVFLVNSFVMTCLVSSMSGGGDSFQVVFFLLTAMSVAAAVVLYRRIGARLIAKAADGA